MQEIKNYKGNKVEYDFSDYKTFKELFRELYYKNITIEHAEINQSKFKAVIRALKRYDPNKDKYIEAKNKFLTNLEIFIRGEKNY